MQSTPDSARMNVNEPIGCIGLGLLGGAMTRRLLENGYQVIGFDIEPARCQSLADAGCRVAHNASEVFSTCPYTLLSLPTSGVVSELVQAHMEEIPPGHVIIDTTTGDPDEMTALAARLATRGISYAEANVAGSSVAAQAGEVVLFLGGQEDVISQIEPLLASLSARRFHLGPVGCGSRFKLVHNLLLGLHRAVLAEGLALADALGFDAATTLQTLEQTPAQSAVMSAKGAKIIARDYTPQARLSQHLKDVRLMLAQARQAGVPTPLSAVHALLLDETEQLGLGDRDNCAIVEWYRQTPTGDGDS